MRLTASVGLKPWPAATGDRSSEAAREKSLRGMIVKAGGSEVPGIVNRRADRSNEAPGEFGGPAGSFVDPSGRLRHNLPTTRDAASVEDRRETAPTGTGSEGGRTRSSPVPTVTVAAVRVTNDVPPARGSPR